MVRLLIRHGAMLDQLCTAYHYTPLAIHLRRDNPYTIRELLDHGADPDVPLSEEVRLGLS